MIRAIDPDKINPQPESSRRIRSEAGGYLKNHIIFTDLRDAYRKGKITKQELLTLRGQVKAGNVAEAMNGLGKLLCRYERRMEERACT